jgi:hypothetical protein
MNRQLDFTGRDRQQSNGQGQNWRWSEMDCGRALHVIRNQENFYFRYEWAMKLIDWAKFRQLGFAAVLKVVISAEFRLVGSG